MAKRVARTEDLFLLIPFLFSNEISFPQRSTDPLSFFFCEFPTLWRGAGDLWRLAGGTWMRSRERGLLEMPKLLLLMCLCLLLLFLLLLLLLWWDLQLRLGCLWLWLRLRRRGSWRGKVTGSSSSAQLGGLQLFYCWRQYVVPLCVQGCQSSKTRQKFQSDAFNFGNGMAKRVESTEVLFHLIPFLF